MIAAILIIFAVIIGLITSLSKGDKSFLNILLFIAAIIGIIILIGFAIMNPQLAIGMIAFIALIVVLLIVNNRVRKKNNRVENETEEENNLNVAEEDAITKLDEKTQPTEFERQIMESVDMADEYEDEKIKELKHDAEVAAKVDYSDIKKKLIEKAKNKQFKTVGDKVIVSLDHHIYYRDYNILLVKHVDDWKRQKRSTEVSYRNEDKTKFYIESIQALGKEDGVSIIPVAIDQANDIVRSDIPFKTSSINYFEFRLRCSVAYQNLP